MQQDMALAPSTVRRMREAKHGSQEPLGAAGQTEGAAARETRIRLAALDTDVGAVMEAAAAPATAGDVPARRSPWMLPVLAGMLALPIGTTPGAARIVDHDAVLLVSAGAPGQLPGK